MKRIVLLSTFIFKCLVGDCQKNSYETNELSLGIPVLWNKTTISNVYGPRRQISGNGTSAGVSIYYKRILSNGMYVKAGLGYFAQNFSIRRPYPDFDFRLLLSTSKKYTYQCLEQTIGIGYRSSPKKSYSFDISANYHRLNTFKQQYFPINPDFETTVTKNWYVFSSMATILPTINKKISDKMGISTGVLIPVYTSWKKDDRFDENRNDTYSPSFHLGIQIGVQYKF